MSLLESDVEKIAHLARLSINKNDIPSYANNLSDILQLIEQMSHVNTDNISPMAHPLDTIQRLRNDEVTESNQREQFQATTSFVEDGLYLVPKVIE